MKVERTVITPEIAAQILTNNTRNRSIKSQNLRLLCEELRAGRWVENGDSIRIDTNGVLIDGQHRLEAVVSTGISITTLVVTGLSPQVFNTIDTGARRSAGDTLAVAGEKSGRNLASALIVLDSIKKNGTPFVGGKKISNAEVMEMLEKYPTLRDSMIHGRALQRIAHPSVSVAMHYLFSEVHPEKCEEFFEGLATGASLDFTNPIYILRQRLIDNATSKGKMSRRYMAALFIKAWNAYRNGRTLKFLRFRENGDAPETFPTLE